MDIAEGGKTGWMKRSAHIRIGRWIRQTALLPWSGEPTE